jgi:hypothetical protein
MMMAEVTSDPGPLKRSRRMQRTERTDIYRFDDDGQSTNGLFFFPPTTPS